ncbi:MAG: methyltransferase [bacterium]|nr:methyltransferase [bacterium]
MSENKRINNWPWRSAVIVLAIIPLWYGKEFYDHFYAYLTGTIINNIIKSQWQVVVASIILFMLFLVPLSYRKRAKWLDYGLVGAFFVSLFIEMYGLPLTIFFTAKYFFTAGARLPENVIGFNILGVGMGMDHAMLYGAVLMILGMIMIISGWYSLYRQSKQGGFARNGLYAYSRNPQYVGFIFLILGWFFGWPTIITVIFSPILIYKYIRAARAEEKEMLALYSDYAEYKKQTPFLI